MLLFLVYFVKVMNNRDVIENFAESAQSNVRDYFSYPKTAGLCTSNQSC